MTKGRNAQKGAIHGQHHQTIIDTSIGQVFGDAGPDGGIRLHGLHEPDQPGLHDHLRSNHRVLLRDSEPEGTECTGRGGIA